MHRARFAPKFPVAARSPGIHRDPGQGRERGRQAEHLLGLVPGAVHREEHRWGASGQVCRVGGARAGEEDGCRLRGREFSHPGVLLEGDAAVQLGVLSAIRVSHALQMASRASRGCCRRTTRVREGAAGSPRQTQKASGRRQRSQLGRTWMPVQWTASNSTSKTSVALGGIAGGAPRAVGQVRGKGELSLAADLHSGDPPVPPLDDLARAEPEGEWGSPDRGVEPGPVEEPARVVHLNVISPDGLRPRSGHQVLNRGLRHGGSTTRSRAGRQGARARRPGGVCLEGPVAERLPGA